MAKIPQNMRFRPPSWFFAETAPLELTYVNFDHIFEICTKFRIRNNAQTKIFVIYPTLILRRNGYSTVETEAQESITEITDLKQRTNILEGLRREDEEETFNLRAQIQSKDQFSST